MSNLYTPSSFSSEAPAPEPSRVFPNQHRFTGPQQVGAIPESTNAQVTQRGGVTSIQFGIPSEEPHAPSTGLGVRVANGGARMNFGDPDAVQGGGVVRVSVGTAENPQGSLLATAKTTWGEPRGVHNVGPGDLVVYQGREMTVAVAEQLGLLRRNGFGNLEDAVEGGGTRSAGDAQERLAERDAQAAADYENVEPFAPGVEAGLSAVMETVDAGTQIDVLSQLASEGMVSQGTLERLASQARIEPQEAARFVEGVATEFENQAKAAVSKYGISDWDHFSEWVSAHHASDVQAAIMKHGMERHTRGYLPLAKAYIEAMDKHSPEAILGASFGSGIRASRGMAGEVVIHIPGKGTYSWLSALKAGLIRVGKA